MWKSPSFPHAEVIAHPVENQLVMLKTLKLGLWKTRHHLLDCGRRSLFLQLMAAGAILLLAIVGIERHNAAARTDIGAAHPEEAVDQAESVRTERVIRA